MGCPKLQSSYLKVAYQKKETGSTNSFELRLWDSRIGRWMSPDPYGQYHSPYLGMGNNPITRVDPDGGEDWYRDEETGDIVWFDGSQEIDGYKHLGFDYSERDSYNNWTIYDGDLKASFYNGKLEQYYGQLDNVVISIDNRSVLEKTGDFTRKYVINPILRTGSKVGNIIMSQTNVILKEGIHSGNPYNWNNYTFNHYREFDNEWNYVKKPLVHNPTLNEGKETLTDVISIFPLSVPLNLSKNKVLNIVIDEATSATVKEGINNSINIIH